MDVFKIVYSATDSRPSCDIVFVRPILRVLETHRDKYRQLEHPHGASPIVRGMFESRRGSFSDVLNID
jgi:hypothetical protein